MSRRPKRQVQTTTEVPVKVPRKWSENEIEILLTCLMKYGHKNLTKIQEQLPERSIENIKTFMRTAHDRAGKLIQKDEVIDAWINLCNNSDGPPWTDCMQVAQVLKYLSVDGLLENHPLPSSSNGIDFGLAYRLIYQAVMGYPIQPVNEATADFVLETLMDLRDEMKKHTDAIKNVDLFLQNKSKTKESVPSVKKSESVSKAPEENFAIKKPLKVYQRKKQNLANTEVVPSLRIIVQEKNCNSEGGPSKDFSVTVEGSNSSVSTTVNVPVHCEQTVNENEEELIKSSSYNPFQIPGKWLEEPFHLNLIQKS